MTHHFNFDGKNRPTLCGYCKNPSGPLIYKDGDYWLGACSMDHLKKIKEGKRLPNKAQLNDEGVEYSIAQTKDIYLELSREEDNQALQLYQRLLVRLEMYLFCLGFFLLKRKQEDENHGSLILFSCCLYLNRLISEHQGNFYLY